MIDLEFDQASTAHTPTYRKNPNCPTSAAEMGIKVGVRVEYSSPRVQYRGTVWSVREAIPDSKWSWDHRARIVILSDDGKIRLAHIPHLKVLEAEK